MEPYNLFIFVFFFCSFLLTSGKESHETTQEAIYKPTKLFVFGDSYVDTGNVRKSLGNSWNEPYGTTFPGKPAGRFSDGRVLTDYLARFLGVKSPLAFTWMKLGGRKLGNGMNFAYGGSGVFNTYDKMVPNMSIQIDFLEKLMNGSVYTKWDLQSSLVLVCLAGNDYGAYVARGGTIEGLQSFIPLVVDRLATNLKRIHELGAMKIVVTALQPLGCLPRMTQFSSFQQCNNTQNLAVNYHNLLLQKAIAKLNNQSNTSSPFFILDLYSSFTALLQKEEGYQGSSRFESPLKPCCMGISNKYSCGSVDKKGMKMYRVCSDPKSSFFWDQSHPTEAGWRAVYMTMNSTLKQFFKLN